MVSYGQQREQYTNYVMNNFVVNPAVAGSYAFWNAKVGYRTQWAGFTDYKTGQQVGPKTFFTSFHGPVGYPDPRRHRRSKIPHQGVGGYVYYDQTGPVSYLGAFGAYSYHQKIGKLFTLSVGAFGGVKQFKLDADQLNFVQTEFDDLVESGVNTVVVPDMNVGAFLYSDFAFFGIAGHQLLNSKLKFTGMDNSAALKGHYFVTGGVKFELNKDLFLYPTIMMKFIYPAPTSIDFNVRMLYSDYVWFGASWRTGIVNSDAVAFVAEYVVNDAIEIGYAYDLTLSRLRKYSYGTHEIMLGLRWANPKKETICPSKYW